MLSCSLFVVLSIGGPRGALGRYVFSHLIEVLLDPDVYICIDNRFVGCGRRWFCEFLWFSAADTVFVSRTVIIRFSPFLCLGL